LAFYSLEESKYADAIELAERATRIDPNSSEGWIVLGAARQATADRKGAKLAYKKCSESAGQYVKECRRLLR
jgi:cytochrome c-type biogenesis protein CcmH/NrfG